MTHIEALAALQALYARIPTISCQRLCGDACGPIGMNYLEWIALRQHAPVRLVGKNEHCPLLRRGQCCAYRYRPLICRLWGTTVPLLCHFGCEPARWLTDEEANDILMEGERLSQMLFPGQRPRYIHTPAQVRRVAEQAAEEFVTRRMFLASTAERLRARMQGDTDD